MMKISMNRDDVLPTLANMARIAGGKSVIPITSHIFIEAMESRCQLVATDLEVQLTVWSENQVNIPGKCVVPAKKFYDICKALPEGSIVQISESEEKCTVKAGKSRFTLHSLPVEDFPYIKDRSDRHEITVNALDCQKALEYAAASMAQDDARTFLNGVLLEVDAQEMRFVATNGHRLSKISLPYTRINFAEEEYQGILPRKAVLELLKILPGSGEVSLSFSSTSFVLKHGDQEFTTKLVDAKYADYRRVIPTDVPKEVVVMNRQAFKSALQQSEVLTSGKNPATSIQVENAVMTLRSNNEEQEEGEVELDVPVDFQGESFRVSFNTRYLNTMVHLSDSEQIKMSMHYNGATIFTADGENGLHLIMPVRG